MAEDRPWQFTTLVNLHPETQVYTARRSFAEAPTEYKFTLLDLWNFLESNFNVVAINGSYASDSDAATGGVAVGEVYELSAANIYGMPEGILKKRTA